MVVFFVKFSLFANLFSLLFKFFFVCLFVKLFSLLFKIYFVCLFVKLFSLLFKIFLVCLFVKLFSSFLPLSRQTNDNFGNFFSNFQGFTLLLVAKSWWNSTWICWKSLKLTEIWISNWTGDFCAAIELSKKFKVLLGFDVVRLGSLNQRQLENFF